MDQPSAMPLRLSLSSGQGRDELLRWVRKHALIGLIGLLLAFAFPFPSPLFWAGAAGAFVSLVTVLRSFLTMARAGEAEWVELSPEGMTIGPEGPAGWSASWDSIDHMKSSSLTKHTVCLKDGTQRHWQSTVTATQARGALHCWAAKAGLSAQSGLVHLLKPTLRLAPASLPLLPAEAFVACVAPWGWMKASALLLLALGIGLAAWLWVRRGQARTLVKRLSPLAPCHARLFNHLFAGPASPYSGRLVWVRPEGVMSEADIAIRASQDAAAFGLQACLMAAMASIFIPSAFGAVPVLLIWSCLYLAAPRSYPGRSRKDVASIVTEGDGIWFVLKSGEEVPAKGSAILAAADPDRKIRMSPAGFFLQEEPQA